MSESKPVDEYEEALWRALLDLSISPAEYVEAISDHRWALEKLDEP